MGNENVYYSLLAINYNAWYHFYHALYKTFVRKHISEYMPVMKNMSRKVQNYIIIHLS